MIFTWEMERKKNADTKSSQGHNTRSNRTHDRSQDEETLEYDGGGEGEEELVGRRGVEREEDDGVGWGDHVLVLTPNNEIEGLS